MRMGGQHHAPTALPSAKRPGTHCVGGWVGPRVGVDERGKSPPPPNRHSILDRSARRKSLCRLHCPGPLPIAVWIIKRASLQESVLNLLYSFTECIRVLISPYPEQEGKKLMFLSEWREFPSAPCLAGKKKLDISRLDVVEIARVPEMLPSLFPSWSG